MERGDNRFRPMCCHFLSDSPCDDKLLGAEECQSPFGTYEISIPIDKKFPCKSKSSRITDENCKDFDVRDYESRASQTKHTPLDPGNLTLLALLPAPSFSNTSTTTLISFNVTNLYAQKYICNAFDSLEIIYLFRLGPLTRKLICEISL